MLQHTFRRLYSTTDEADWNAFVEAFCIHARNLKMFLTNDRGKGSNGAIARDFAQFDAKPSPQLTGVFQRMTDQTVHLNKSRTTQSDNKFDRLDAEAVMNWIRPL